MADIEQMTEFGLTCMVSYALKHRRRSQLRLMARGGIKAAEAAEVLAREVVDHIGLCGLDIVGVNSDDAAFKAILAGILSVNDVTIADLARKHCRIEESGLYAARVVLDALQARGGRIVRLKPLPPLPNTHPKQGGLAPPVGLLS